MKDKVEFWDRVAGKYDSKSLETYKDAYDATVDLSLKWVEGRKNVLEYACGTGITTIRFAEHAERIAAVDISAGMIEEAQKKAAEKEISNIDFRTGSLSELNFDDESFDVVTAFNVIYFLEKPVDVLKQLNSLLVPGGIFLSATDCIGEGKTFKAAVQKLLMMVGFLPSFRLMRVSELEKMIMKAGFEIIEQKNLFDAPPNMFIAARKKNDKERLKNN